MTWISNSSDIAEWLYSRNVNDTFAVQYGDNLEVTKYATITAGPYKDRRNYSELDVGEPYDIVVEVELRKNPSADFTENCSISHNPMTDEVFVKEGVGRFSEIKAICTESLEADYQSNRKLIAECSECGTQTEISVEKDQVSSSKMKRNAEGDMIVPCCRTTNWVTKLADD